MAEPAPDLPAGSETPDLDLAAAFWTGERPIHAASLPGLALSTESPSRRHRAETLQDIRDRPTFGVASLRNASGPVADGGRAMVPPGSDQRVGVGRAMSDQPGVDVGEHGVGQAMGAGIGLEGDAESAGAKGRDVVAGVVERDLGVPGAVHDQDGEVATGLEPAQGPQADRQPAVDGDDAGEPLGKGQAEPVGDRGPFAATDQEDPLGVDVQQLAGLEDRREDGLFQTVERFGLRVEQDASDDLGFGRRPACGAPGGARAARTRGPSRSPPGGRAS